MVKIFLPQRRVHGEEAPPQRNTLLQRILLHHQILAMQNIPRDRKYASTEVIPQLPKLEPAHQCQRDQIRNRSFVLSFGHVHSKCFLWQRHHAIMHTYTLWIEGRLSENRLSQIDDKSYFEIFLGGRLFFGGGALAFTSTL
ncbi:hypothetical protein AAZV13_20G019000 [Glycine max]